MRVALTGATGFVGARLAERLVEDGCTLQALVHPDADPAPLARRGVAVVRGDVRDRAAVARALAGAELVYHLAGVVPGAARKRAEFRAINVGGAENVVDAAVTGGVAHLVHCSTVAVHGSPRRAPADENAPFAPVNAYQATKVEAEHVVERGARARGLSAVVARLTALYGPGDRRVLRLFRDVARGRLVIVGAGASRCQLTHVDDAVAGLRLCGGRRPSRAERFIIAGDEHPTVDDLVRMIAAALGVTPRVVRLPAAPFAAGAALYRALTRRYAPVPGVVDRLDFFLGDHAWDAGKARRELGFRARVPLGEGLASTAVWYREMRLI